MSFESWLSFIAVALVAVLSPGPAILLAVTHANQFGVRRTLFPILGNITGLGILTIASSVGIGSLLETSSGWFFWLRIVGGMYLVYLGFKLLYAAYIAKKIDQSSFSSPVTAPTHKRAYLQGIMVALSNPKALLFIGALFPQFLDLSSPVWPQLMLLGLTLMVMSFTALVIYAVLSKTLVAKGKEAAYGKVNKITGFLFILFGVTLAAGSR
ncbi:MAG: LysE family translocator [Rhodospirillales bacterium]|nr:LysE family translocator [Rhodospirillales bacterium]